MKRGKKPIEESQKKRPVTAFLEPDVYERIKGMAAEEELTVSETINALLKRAVMHKDTGRWYDLFGPAIENRISREMQGMSNRLAHLLARTALESTASREMLTRFMLADMVGPTGVYSGQQDKAVTAVKQVREQSWNHAVKDLKKPSEGVREILGTPAGETRNESE